MSRTEEMVQDRVGPYNQEQDVPDGYKRTEVGVIPEDWEVTKLENAVSSIQSGKSKLYKEEGEYPFYGSKGLIGYSNTYDYSGANILIARVGSYAGSIYSVSGRYCVSDNTIILVNRDYDQSFLFHALKYLGISNIVFGSGQPLITGTQLKKIKATFPPLPEQRAIATALSDVDHLLESLDKLIAKKRAIKQAAMQELLTGKTRLPGFRGEWIETPLNRIAEIRSGGTPSTTNHDFWGGKVAWCTPTDITALCGRKHLSQTERTITQAGLQASSAEIIPPNSIIMTTRATIGECAINTVPMTTNQGFKNLVPIAVNTEFLYYLMTIQKEQLIQLCAGSTFLEIGKQQLQRFVITIPKDIEEQNAIATVISNIDAEIEALKKRREKIQKIKQGMMQELLTGRIRLVKDTSKVKTQNSAPVRKLSPQNRNWQFEEAVIIAVLADTFGKREFPLNRFRYQKMVYLLRRFTKQETDGFLKKAAGPYKPASRYKGPEKIALDKQYVQEVEAINRNGKMYKGFISGEMIQEAHDYFEKWFGNDALQWLQQFKFEKSEKLELLTTVDMAVQDLKTEGKPVSVEAVQQLINNHEEWRPKLKRRTFSSDNIHDAIEKIEQLLNVSE